MKCTNCNAENMEGALFCSECGTRFAPPENIDTPSAEAADTPAADTPAADAVELPSPDDAQIPAADPLEETIAEDFQVPENAPSPFAPAPAAEPEAVSEIDQTVAMGFQENADSIAPTTPIFQPAQEAPVQPEFPQAPAPAFQSAPEFQSAPQPAAPMNYVDPSAPSEKKQKKFLVPMVIFAVLFALAAAAIGVGTYLFLKEKKDNKDLKAQVENCEAEIDEKDDQISNLEDDVKDYVQKQNNLQNEIVELTNEKDQLANDLATAQNDSSAAQKEIAEYKKQAEDNAKELQGIYSDIDKLQDPNRTFYANRNVIVLQKGANDNIPVTLSGASGNFTFNCNSNNKNVDVKWENDWLNEGKNAICSLTITAGNATGKTVLTFTNTMNSDSFQVIVFVI